jgi:hypothetical protein
MPGVPLVQGIPPIPALAPAIAPEPLVAPVLPPPAAAPAPVLPPAASSPADLPGMPHHPGPAGPLVGEQFGPLTVTTPGPAR